MSDKTSHSDWIWTTTYPAYYHKYDFGYDIYGGTKDNSKQKRKLLLKKKK